MLGPKIKTDIQNNRKAQRLQTKVLKYSQIQTPKRTDRGEFVLINVSAWD